MKDFLVVPGIRSRASTLENVTIFTLVSKIYLCERKEWSKAIIVCTLLSAGISQAKHIPVMCKSDKILISRSVASRQNNIIPCTQKRIHEKKLDQNVKMVIERTNSDDLHYSRSEGGSVEFKDWKHIPGLASRGVSLSQLTDGKYYYKTLIHLQNALSDGGIRYYFPARVLNPNSAIRRLLWVQWNSVNM